MADFFKTIENQIVNSKVNRGEGTGSTSKILSGVTLLILVYLLVVLFKDKQYIPLVILLLLGFTRYGNFILVGLFAYFIITKYWNAAAILFLWLSINWFSIWLGMRNVKKNLYSEKLNIDPFEGMNLLLSTIFQLVSFALALLTSGVIAIIFWVLFGLATLYEVVRYYGRLRSQWCRIYYPLMVRYSGIAGWLMGRAEMDKNDFNIDEALHALVKNVYANWEENEIALLLESARHKLIEFSDRDALTVLFKNKNPTIDHTKLQEIMSNVETICRNSENKGLLIRYVIGEIIFNEYGEKERRKYVYEVITGRI